MQKILLIDDDVELTGMLGEYLEQEGFDVVSVHNSGLGLTEALSGKYAIAVLDVMMPRMNGIETLRYIRMKSRIPILMLTGRGDDSDRIAGLEQGADDYVPKPCTPRELTARIRAILRRTQTTITSDSSSTILEVGNLKIWIAQRRAEWQGDSLHLSSTKFNILCALARQAGRTVPKKILANLGLGRPLARFDRSIDVHVSSIRRKLGSLPDGRSSIQTIHRQGYQFITS